MRTIPIAVFLLFAAAASAAEPGDGAISLRLAQDVRKEAIADPERPSPPRHSAVMAQDELLGDTLGRWLGVRDGSWDMFADTLAPAGKGGPTIAGTIRKNAAEILLRWHPDE